ncbi:hypothetical protein GGR50DRAFT_296074 [Xylaria sp. CBS 124048]|nr:hypothetical protein GGR50DRAFT_296074 [Xylaria sp. CBS 124048]
MPITNLVWLTSSSDTLTTENKAAMAAALDAQADWVAHHVPSAPTDRDLRGVALFQQIEDPRVVMETAHWSSGDEHNTWLASEEYKASSAPLGAHFDFGKLEYFHLDTDALRPVNLAASAESLLTSPVISVSRIQIPADNKQEMSKARESGKMAFGKFAEPRVVSSGFRIQKQSPITDELVVFAGWSSVEKHSETGQLLGCAEYGKFMRNATDVDVKHYRRIL